MRLFSLLLAFFVFMVYSPPAEAEPGDGGDLFVTAYVTAQKGEKAEEAGQLTLALSRLREAARILEVVAKKYPRWSPVIVKYRKERTVQAIARVRDEIAHPEAYRPHAATDPTDPRSWPRTPRGRPHAPADPTMPLKPGEYPLWSPMIVKYRKERTPQASARVREEIAHPGTNRQHEPAETSTPVKPAEAIPKNWREFEFNGMKYYRIPLGVREWRDPCA